MKTLHPFSLLLWLGLAAMPVAQAQNSPRIGYVYPAGGRQGSTFQVVVGGQFIQGPTNVLFSGAGVHATVIDYSKPLSQKEFTTYRDQLKELVAKRVAANQKVRKRGKAGAANARWTDADEKLVAELKKKLSNPPNRAGNPAIAETVILQLQLDADAAPGDREMRLDSALGLSNPLRFCIGQLPEFTKPAAHGPRGTKANREQQSSVPEQVIAATLPAVLNGQVMPGTAERFNFQARKGMKLVVAANARELIPYLPDAVPGWFQATLAIYDAKGNELRYADDFRFHPDPVLYYEIPSDGTYIIEIRDAIYRGREDFVYRITIGELPFITSIFPLGGSVGAKSNVELKGWNLTSTNLAQDNTARAPGVYSVVAGDTRRGSNPMSFDVDTLPECLDDEPNNQPASAQRVTLPMMINGRIDKPGDWDVFRFEGKAGQEIVAEVMARRLNSPLDSVLKLTDAREKQLAFNDDFEDKGDGLNTHHADSFIRATLPADGAYFISLGDAQRQGGLEFAYRLRISEPRPDFELRVVPSSINIRSGSCVPLTVYALRKDGFSNEIALVLKDAPAGFSLSGGVIPANQDQIRITLSAPFQAPLEPCSLQLEGRARINGQTVSHPGVPAQDMMQAFAYRHLVPAQEMKVAVSGRFPAKVSLRVIGDGPVKIPVGGTGRVHVAGLFNAFLERSQLELSEPPEGIKMLNITPVRDGAEIEIHCDADKAKPGLKGNLIISAFAGKAAAPAGKPKQQLNRRAFTTLPAIPFEIVEAGR